MACPRRDPPSRRRSHLPPTAFAWSHRPGTEARSPRQARAASLPLGAGSGCRRRLGPLYDEVRHGRGRPSQRASDCGRSVHRRLPAARSRARATRRSAFISACTAPDGWGASSAVRPFSETRWQAMSRMSLQPWPLSTSCPAVSAWPRAEPRRSRREPRPHLSHLRIDVLGGDITLTVRLWQRPRVKESGRYRVGPGEIEVDAIELVPSRRSPRETSGAPASRRRDAAPARRARWADRLGHTRLSHRVPRA